MTPWSWVTAFAAAGSCHVSAQDFQTVRAADLGVQTVALPCRTGGASAYPGCVLAEVSPADPAFFSEGTATASAAGASSAEPATQSSASLPEPHNGQANAGVEKLIQAIERITSVPASPDQGTGTASGSPQANNGAAGTAAGLPSQPESTSSGIVLPPSLLSRSTPLAGPMMLANVPASAPVSGSGARNQPGGPIASAAETPPSIILPDIRQPTPTSAIVVADQEVTSASTAFSDGGRFSGTTSTAQTGGQAASDLRAGPILAEPQDPSLSSPGPRVRTLQQALARTYLTNPDLMARRAELRGLDSAVAQERAAAKPQLSAGAALNQELYITRKLGTRGRNLNAGANYSQVLFAGGRIRNAVEAARTRVLAGRADLRATEGNLLTEAVAAYADVWRDRDIRELNLSQVRILETNLESTQARFRVRDLTLTDVAQSEARLDVARSNLAAAEGRLQASEENFERVVGARAGQLEPLPPLPPLPLTPDQAVEATLANNANVAAFAARARAAGYDVGAAKSERLPILSVVSSAFYDDRLGTADSALGLPAGTTRNSETNIGAGFSLQLPLYQGGAASARVRLAEESRARQVEEATAVERLVIADARTAFSSWRSALMAISYNESALAANEKALESVKVEQTVGARSILDVLNAEQELLNAKIALATSQRDAYVSAIQLLNAMGAAEAADLNLDAGPLYDPRANYRRYADTWSDWADGPRRPPASTRNVSRESDSPLTQLNNGTLNANDLDD